MIDLDAVGEEIATEQIIRADGREFRFPGSLSVNRLKTFAPEIESLQKVASGEVDAAGMLDLVERILTPLAGPDQTAEIMEHVGIVKVQRMILALFEVYGVGEASASQPSSKNTGKRSRPTSKAKASTSDTPSSDQDTNTPSESFV